MVRPRFVCPLQSRERHWRFRCSVDDSLLRHEKREEGRGKRGKRKNEEKRGNMWKKGEKVEKKGKRGKRGKRGKGEKGKKEKRKKDSFAPVLLFWRRVKSADVLKGIRQDGFSQGRWDALLGRRKAVCDHGPCGSLRSLEPWVHGVLP